MNDLARPKLFLDTSLIVAPTLAEDPASPGRRLFKMGEVGLIDLWVSNHVIREAAAVLNGLLGGQYLAFQAILAENLVLANIATTADPSEETIQMCIGITNYLPDARVLAAAIERDCEVLVAYDKQHLLKNPKIGPPNTRLVVMSGGEALDWAVDQVTTRARLRQEQERQRKH
ncbi:MAG: type II toxin-antitoxin system VapC family toxin [Armatimonadetes bacterium]|nr:type II toxin-antitoxin system VapC family toxin [Armatimonadota bacterium]